MAECLSHFASEMAAEGGVPPRTLVAMEMLAKKLRERERRARKEFASRFAEFDSHPHRVLLKKFFAPARDAGL